MKYHNVKKNNIERLTDTERGRIKSALTAYMETHPYKEAPKAPTASPYMSFSFLTRVSSTPVLAALMLCVISGTGTLLAAEKSLPGETLYPIKKNISEEIYGLLIFNERSKAEYEAGRIDRRIAEAQTLSSQGKLTEETREGIAESISVHAEKATEFISLAQGNSELFSLEGMVTRARLEGAVEAKKNLLATLPSSDSPEPVVLARNDEVTLSKAKLSTRVLTSEPGPVLAPYQSPLSDSEQGALESIALKEASKTHDLLTSLSAPSSDTSLSATNAREMSIASESQDSRLTTPLELARIRLELLIKEVEGAEGRDRTRLLTEVVRISEEIRSYLKLLPQEEPVSLENKSDSVLPPYEAN